MTWSHPAALSPSAAPSEQETLETLARQFGVVLRHFFQRRVRDLSEVEDLVQEVFMRLLKRGNIATLENLRGYLFETASSVLLDRARKRASRFSDEHQSFDIEAHGNEDFSTERVLIGQETLCLATRALLELPERARTIFILRRLEGLQYQDIARRLNVSVSLVEKQMARAVAYLTQRMSEE